MNIITGLNLKLLTSLSTVIIFITLSGCTSIGTHLLSNPSTYLPEENLIDIDPNILGFEKREYCPEVQPLCIKYLFASAYQPEEFSSNGNVYYNVHATGNGVENSITYIAKPDSFNRINGTAILLHGFGGSKEAMLATSIYFRAIGMDVIALDLYGHGESHQEFKFGAKEHNTFNELINNIAVQGELKLPIIALGHSMGALTASNLLIASDKIDGAILLAPMMRFDLAAKHYIEYKSPTLSKLFDSRLNDIVARTMSNKQVKLIDTDIPSKLKGTQKPILVINSNVDTISPPEYFKHLTGDSVQHEIFIGRNHPSLIAFDQADAKLIESWIKKVANLH